MKIENIRLSRQKEHARLSADVIWETRSHPRQTLYFEVTSNFADALRCSPHPFLIAGLMPALYFGETRISIDAELCPELMTGLKTALSWMLHWFYQVGHRAPRIEAGAMTTYKARPVPQQAGFLFSGGVDSLSTLRLNHLHYPSQHPGFIRWGLIVYGLEVRDTERFRHVTRALSEIQRDSHIELVAVNTNIRDLGPENNRRFWKEFWLNEFMGACFAAIAHALANLYGTFYINSCHDIPNIMPYSSHPLINPNFSSSNLKIKHEGITLSRLEKTRSISDWAVALKNLRVCNNFQFYQNGRLNCGECEKCIRTMLALTALGVLEKADAFPISTVTPALIEKGVQIGYNTLPLYEEMIAPLSAAGCHDLAAAIENKIKQYHRNAKKTARQQKIKAPLKTFDEKYFNGNLRRAKRRILHGAKRAGRSHTSTDRFEAPVFLISFPKAGRTWLALVLAKVFAQHFELPDTNLLQLEQLPRIDRRIPRIHLVHDDAPHWKTPQELETDKSAFDSNRVIFLVRDPRDVVVSLFFEKNKRLATYLDQERQLYRNLLPHDRVKPYAGDLAKFVREPEGSLDTLIHYYAIWWQNRKVPSDFLLVRYEDMQADTVREVRRVLDFLDLNDIADATIEAAVQYCAFENMRKMERENRFNSHRLKAVDRRNEETYKTRRGKVGGFHDYFQPSEIDYLNAKLQHRVLDALGYGLKAVRGG